MTVAMGFTTAILELASAPGAISQPADFNRDITVTSNFNWTGGTLNSSAYASVVHLIGATGTIDSGAGNTIRTGSTLDLTNSAALTIQPGTVEFANGVGVVAENSTMFINAQTGNGTAANVKLEGLQNVTFTDNRLLLLKTGATLTVTGPGTWTSDKMALGIGGGTVDIQNGASAVIKTPDAMIHSYPVYMASGILRLHTGSTITADDNGVGMTGGNFIVVGDLAGPAKINGDFYIGGGMIKFTGNKAIFEVTGGVSWTGGVFMPRINLTENGLRDWWYIKGNLAISPLTPGQPITATISPNSENYDPIWGSSSAYRWTVIRVDGTRTGAPQIITDGPYYQLLTGIPVPGGDTRDWMLWTPPS